MYYIIFFLYSHKCSQVVVQNKVLFFFTQNGISVEIFRLGVSSFLYLCVIRLRVFMIRISFFFSSSFDAFNEMVIVRMYAVYPMQALIKLSEFLQFTPSKLNQVRHTIHDYATVLFFFCSVGSLYVCSLVRS